MQGSVSVTMKAPAGKIWDLIADVRNTGRFSPEVIEAEWLDGTTVLERIRDVVENARS
jgi:hypothetical protein